MSLIHLTSLAAIPAAEWDALLPDDQPFLRHAFLLTLEQSGSVRPESGWQPDHLLWQEKGVTRAALPGYQKYHSQGEYVFDHAWADASQRAGIRYYPKWLGAIPFSPVCGARLLGDPAAAAQLLSALPASLLQHGLSGAHINFTDAQADRLLASQPGQILSRDQILQAARGIGFDGLDRSVDVCIGKLRRKLGDDAREPRRIKTVWGRGYQFNPSAWSA